MFGKIFKGRKLSKISPNKTISGALGSIFFSSVIINFIFYYFLNLFIKFLFLSIFTSITNQLVIFLFKRKAKIKDTGYFYLKFQIGDNSYRITSKNNFFYNNLLNDQ